MAIFRPCPMCELSEKFDAQNKVSFGSLNFYLCDKHYEVFTSQLNRIKDIITSLLDSLPDSMKHESKCWKNCWDALDSDEQDEVKEVRRKANRFLKEI